MTQKVTRPFRVVFSDQEFPTSIVKSLFLAGPSPRSSTEADWRHTALEVLASLGYDGTVFLPVPSHRFNPAKPQTRPAEWSYDGQIAWECDARQRADVIVFWVPRVIDPGKPDLGMPGFTTNFELGEDLATGKVIYGRPAQAQKCRYLDQRVEEAGLPVHESLESLLSDAVHRLSAGAIRTGGETRIPLSIWQCAAFQAWYANLRSAGNRLDGAQVLNTVRVVNGRFLFAFTMRVQIWIAAECRHKNGEVIVGRPDISAVIAFYRDESNAVHLALVREFRSPVNNPTGYVYELPGGSSFSQSEDPVLNAREELSEETGLQIDRMSRFKRIGCRQLASTFSIHRAQVYAVELVRQEFEQLRSCSERQQVFGQANHSEQTYVELTPLDRILDLPLDYAMLGMVFEAAKILGLINQKTPQPFSAEAN